MTNTAIYVRVSKSDGSQDVQRQIDDLRAFCELNKWNVAKIVKENVSGRKKNRQGTVELINLARANRIKKVLVHEVSRLGRNAADVFQTVEALCEAKCSVYDYQQRQETLDNNNQKTVYATIILPLLAGFAEQWSNDHAYRIRSGLNRAVKNGKTLGRKPAEKLKNEDKAVQLLIKGKTIADIMKACNIGKSTVLRIRKKNGFEGERRIRSGNGFEVVEQLQIMSN